MFRPVSSSARFAASDGVPRAAPADAVVEGERYRFTVLTSRLIRMEWSESGEFVDQATAVVASRDFDVPEFTVTRDGDALTISTAHVELHYDGGEFGPEGLTVDLKGAPDIHYSTWRYGVELPQMLPFRGNLGGTARTLDEIDGECPLEPGLLATYGFATLDDSTSVVMDADGWVAPRGAGHHDLYLFAHGRDYQGALDDYFLLTGRPALVPRYVLGNWWSRYWRYDHESYVALMDEFAREGLPFSVAVIDMDWHVVDVDPEIGTGWTGYTWNTDLFPDPPAFLDALHERGLAVTLNVHPADGVRRHEEAYPEMARALGVDPASGDAIPFDIASREFVDAYLKQLHHPLEADGVDFWWLDWQSGGYSRIPGLDPLWMLNHVHFRDSGRNGHRPLTFSRYSGPGSHRYPIGFSGDTIATWASLDFQPKFTATAANIGYHWWSHDIGGHMHGVADWELIARWIQFGVFSPVNRLHSSSSAFASKEPGLLGPEAGPVAASFLRLRHLLVPYLYSAAWASHRDGVALARPVYHAHPSIGAAYEYPNSYLFGPDLLVAPITTPRDEVAMVGRARVWLPEGTWTDIFTGATYRGGRVTTLHRPLETYPVLARAGALVPLSADPLAQVDQNPAALVVKAFPGDGESTLIEDDGSARPEPVRTVFSQQWSRDEHGAAVVVTAATEGVVDRPVESLSFDLVGVGDARSARVEVDGVEHPCVIEPAAGDVQELLAPALRVRVENVNLAASIRVTVTGVTARENDADAQVVEILRRARIEYWLKDRGLAAVQRLTGLELADELSSVGMPEVLRLAITEIVSATDVAEQVLPPRAFPSPDFPSNGSI